VLLLVGGLYIGGGMALGVQTTGSKAELSAHPHYKLWQEVHGLVNDGLAVVVGGGRIGGGGGRGGGIKVGQERLMDEGRGVARESASSRQEEKSKNASGEKEKKSASPKEKSAKAHKKGSSSSGGSGSKQDRRAKAEKHGATTAAAASAPPLAAPPEEPREWQPTRSILQQGARETGVKVGGHVPGQGLVGLRTD
jgi:hypothetical protein